MEDRERQVIKQAVHEAVTESGILTDQEVRRIVRETVRETLLKSGINPDESQAISDDLRYVREWRTMTSSIKNKSILAIVGLLISGFAALLILGIRSAFQK